MIPNERIPQKKERKAQSAEAPVAQGQPVKKGMSRGLKATLIVVCAIVVIAAVVFFSMVTGGYFCFPYDRRDRRFPQPDARHGQLFLQCSGLRI